MVNLILENEVRMTSKPWTFAFIFNVNSSTKCLLLRILHLLNKSFKVKGPFIRVKI